MRRPGEIKGQTYIKLETLGSCFYYSISNCKSFKGFQQGV